MIHRLVLGLVIGSCLQFCNETKGDKLNTEHLTWDGKSRKVYTNAFVRITTPDKVMTGTGLESDETFSKYKILNVKGIIRR